MSLSAVVTRLTARTTNGTQQTTIGFQPKALIAIASFRTADGFGAEAYLSVGIAVGTAAGDQRCIGVSCRDNVATTVNDRFYDSLLVGISDNTATSYQTKATVSAIDSTSYTLTYTTSGSSTAFNIDVLALGGDDITVAKVVEFALGTGTGNQSVTVTGFTSGATDQVVLFLGSSLTAAGLATEAKYSIGCAESSSARWALCGGSRNAQTMSANVDAVTSELTNACLLGIVLGGSTVDWQADFVSHDTDGFTINKSNAATASYLVAALAIKGLKVDVGAFNKPTGSAPQTSSITAPNFRPGAVLMASWGKAASASVATEVVTTVGMADDSGTPVQGSHWANMTDAINQRANRRQLNKAMMHNTQPSTSDSEGSVAMTSSGFDVTWNPNNATAVEELYLALGAAPASFDNAFMVAIAPPRLPIIQTTPGAVASGMTPADLVRI